MPENARAVSQGRIATLDILRGVAILGILYLNMLYMGNHGVEYEMTGDPRPFGWTSADQAYYLYFRSLMNGTQRGILELLFGASAIILTGQVMSRDGPVEAADIYFRRAFWLMIFGILHGTLLLWYGGNQDDLQHCRAPTFSVSQIACPVSFFSLVLEECSFSRHWNYQAFSTGWPWSSAWK